MKDSRFYALYLAWCVSLIGLLLSLYFGEFLGYEPCALCWYQRIALFPLVLFLGMASFRFDVSIVPYALPLAALGALVAVYQTLGQMFPSLLKIGAVCGVRHDCSSPIFTLFGFLTLPGLSALGFFLIIGLLIQSAKKA